MRITAKQAAELIKNTPKMLQAVAKRAALVSAHRSVTALKKLSPVDMGVYRAAWKVVPGFGRMLAKVENRSPVAGVVEKGARPHAVSAAGREAIRAWVIRKGIATPEEADAVVWGIVQKLKREGQKGLHLLEKQIPTSAKWFQTELERLLREKK